MLFAHLISDIVSLSPRQPAALALPSATAPSTARAAPSTRGELHVGLGLQGGTSNWPGDPLGYGSVTVGVRLLRVLTPFVGGALGYARIDQRLLTRLNVGLALGTHIHQRFYLRGHLSLVHQHEESLAAVAQEPLGATLGIGHGIRHRAGLHFGAGFDVVLQRTASYELTLGPDLSAIYLAYSSGPSWCFLAGITAAGHFRLF